MSCDALLTDMNRCLQKAFLNREIKRSIYPTLMIAWTNYFRSLFLGFMLFFFSAGGTNEYHKFSQQYYKILVLDAVSNTYIKGKSRGIFI